MSNAFRAEQLDAGINTGVAGHDQDYHQQAFAGGNAEYFEAKQSGSAKADLHSVQFVDGKHEESQSEAGGADHPGSRTEKGNDANELFQDSKVELLQPMVSWKIEVKDTPSGGKQMGIKGLGEGELVKQSDGSFKGDLVNRNGEKTPVKINADGSVMVELDGEEYQIERKADGTVDSVTNLRDAFVQRTDRPDGSGEIKFKDGRPGYTFRSNADGSEERQYADGSTEHAGEGGSLRKYPNGSTREVMADGTTVYNDAATGVVVRMTPDHITTITYKDGTKITQLPNGTSVTRDPDGTTRTQRLLDSTTKLPDGTVVRTNHRMNGDVNIEVVPPGQKPPAQHKPAAAPQRPRTNPIPSDGAPRPENSKPGELRPVRSEAQLSTPGDATAPYVPADKKSGH